MSDNHKELENGRPGRIGRVTPVDQSSPTEKSHNVAVENKAGGNQLTQINQLSTPVLVAMFSVLAVMTVGLAVVGIFAGIAVGKSETAMTLEVLGERQSALARNHADNLEIDVRSMKAVLEARGIKVPDEVK